MKYHPVIDKLFNGDTYIEIIC